MTTAFFEDSTYYTGPELTDDMVSIAEERLGYRLPTSYVELLRVRNGGKPRRRCFRTPFKTSWAPHHIQIEAIRGVGGTWGIDSPGGLSSAAMIAQWGYPTIGIVICDMPSAGHDAVMLDYSGIEIEPSVVYVDEDRRPKLLAKSFSEFVRDLIACDEVERSTAS